MRLRALDGWRGLGAIAVALGHLEIGGLAYFGGYLSHGHVLVDFFFVASGFVISLIYVDALGDGRSVRNFVIRRFGRIWPLHAFVLGLFIAVELAKAAAMAFGGYTPSYAPFTSSRPDEMILPTLLMLHTFGIDDGLTWNFPSWSVAAEFWTYMLFAVVVVATRSRPVLRLAVAAALVAGAGLFLAGWSPNRMDATYDYGFVRCVYGFFTGMMLEALWRTGWLSRLKGHVAEFVAAAVAVTFVGTGAGLPIEFFAPLVYAIPTLVFAADAGILSRFLSWRGFEALGRWSYSIYLVHAFVITCVMPHVASRLAVLFDGDVVRITVAVTVIYLPLVVALSAFTYRFVEVPGQALASALVKAIDRRSPKREPRPAPAAAESRAPVGAPA